MLLILAAGTALAAVFYETAGPDTIKGTSSADDIQGFSGSDRLHSGTGTDAISGGAGGDNSTAVAVTTTSTPATTCRETTSNCDLGYDVYNAEPLPGAPQDFIADDCEAGAL